MKKEILFIINPISGTRHRDDVERAARKILSADKFEMEFVTTRYKGEGAELARKAAAEGVDIVAAVGGDGTINEVASQLVHTNTAFALIPHGSGNGLAYHLHIPIHLEKALQVVNGLHVETVDACQINGKFFFSIAGIGFDAKVAHDFNREGHRGFINYFKHILKNYFEYNSGSYSIEYDGQVMRDKAFFITFANSSQWGYNVKIAPMASIQDGLVNICIVKRPKLLLKMLNVDLPMLLSSRIDQSSVVQYLNCEKVKILPCDSCPMYLHIDGDAAGIVEQVDLQVVPRSLKILAPSFI